MRVRFRHRFEAPKERVARVLLDPAYQERLTELPNVGERRVREVSELADGTTRVVVFCSFDGDIPDIVKRTIGGSVVSWDEVGVFHPGTHTWRITIRPMVFQGRFAGGGTYAYRDDGSGTVREIEIDYSVKVPVVGGRVERAIRDGLEDVLEAEAKMLSDYLH